MKTFGQPSGGSLLASCRLHCALSGLLVVAGIGGCYTSGSTPEDSGQQSDVPWLYEPADPATYEPIALEPAPLRRLSKDQFHNVLRDYFGDDLVIPELDEPDTITHGLVSVGRGTTTFSARAVGSLETASYGIAEQIAGSEAIRQAVVPCTPLDTVDAECAREALVPMARHIWRRSPTDGEVDRLVEIAGDSAEALDDFYQGLGYGIAAILQSPHFIFRSEVGETRDGEHVFTDVEFASRLSFFLWNSGPDEALLDAAEAGELSTEAERLAEALRMLESPRARVGIRSFFGDYLQLQGLDTLTKIPDAVEFYYALLGPDAKEETLRVIERLVFDEPGDFRDLLTSRTTILNQGLAALYGIPAPALEGFAETELPEDGERRGLLGHASFLSLHSHQSTTSATRRGKAVRMILLCQDMPEPPVDVDASIPEPSNDLPTLRDRVQEHMVNPACAGCHSVLDPIGLGLENYDPVGRWRDRENGVLIDASGELDGAPFETPSDLGWAVREHPNFVPCLVQTLVRYARGRVESGDEASWLDTLTARFVDSGHDFRTLVLDVITSPQFQRIDAPVEED